MAKFMFDGFRRTQVKAFWLPPSGSSRNECWIFHTKRLRTRIRIHQSESLVRIRTVPAVEVVHAFFENAGLPLDLTPVARLHHDSQLHRAHAALKGVVIDQVMRARGPCEIVNVIRVVADGFRAVRVVQAANFNASGPNHFVLGHRELDVINAEVREKLGVSVKLVAIPGAMPPNPSLGEPLTTENKVAIPTSPLQGLRKLIVDLDLELDIPIGRDGL